MNVNKVILVGRLTSIPEVRKTQSGQSVATLRIATNNFWQDKHGVRQERTEFHSIVLWGRLAEIAGQYLVKGQECYIEGRLETRKYANKDGVQMHSTEIIGESMQLGVRPGANPGSEVTEVANTRDQTTPGVSKPGEELPTIEL